MDEQDKARIVSRYNKRLDEFGYDIRTLASGTEERRNIRFRVLQEVGIATGDSVLDVGCGFGDFYRYLVTQGIDVDYVGYDINPELIKVAREQFPEASFEVKDIQGEDFPCFDFVVSSSAFNLPLSQGDNYVFIRDILTRCYGHARKGVAVDLLSAYVDRESPQGFHYQPETIFSIGKELTKRVALRHDFPLYDFCVYLFPDFEGWGA